MDKELEKKTNFIISSKIIIDSSIGPLFFILPLLKDRQIAEYYYDRSIIELKLQKIPTMEDTLRDHKMRGLWSDAKDKQIEKLGQFIKDNEGEIELTKQPSKLKKLKNWQKYLERSLIDLLNSKNTMLGNTVETIANEKSLSYLIWNSFRNLKEERIWDSYENLLQSDQIALIKELQFKYIELLSYFSTAEVRKIARTSYWRTRWNICKSSINDLFGRDLLDISNEQFLLIYWSQIYDSVYEALERPPNEVIDDDEKLDAWLKEQSEKNKTKTSQNYHAKTTNSAISKSGEIFKVVDGYYNKEGYFVKYSADERWKRIEEIRKTNHPMVRKIMEKEEKRLAENPNQLIQEHRLRRTGRDREMMGGRFKPLK